MENAGLYGTDVSAFTGGGSAPEAFEWGTPYVLSPMGPSENSLSLEGEGRGEGVYIGVWTASLKRWMKRIILFLIIG